MPRLDITAMAEAFVSPLEADMENMAPRLFGSDATLLKTGVALESAPYRLLQSRNNGGRPIKSRGKADSRAIKASTISGMEPKSQKSQEPNTLEIPNRLQIREFLEGLGAEPLADDIRFYRENLPIDTSTHNDLLRKIGAMWGAAMQAEKNTHKKQNAGRYAANCWLRTELGISA